MTRAAPLVLALMGGVLAPAAAQSAGDWFRWRPGQRLETSLLFHPTRFDESWLPAPDSLAIQDVWLDAADGNRIHAWWFPHPQSQGTVLFCHGNAGNLSHRSPTVVNLANALRRSVLIFDYPGYGRSDGKPDESGCYAAADAAYEWLTDSAGIAPNDIVLFGESLGGGVATDLALRRPHAALVLVKTFTSIPGIARARLLTSASAALVRNRFDNLAKIGRCPAPVFIAHGDRDRVIPFSQAQQLLQAAPEPKRFFLLKGDDHNDPPSRELSSWLWLNS